jgi:two-component system sensor histidine kinase/response regulator
MSKPIIFDHKVDGHDAIGAGATEATGVQDTVSLDAQVDARPGDETSVDVSVSVRPAESQTVVAKEAIRARARLQHLLDYTPTIIYSSVPSGDFKLTFVSDNITRVLGYSADEVTGDPNFWFNHIHHEDRPAIFQRLPQLFVHEEHVHEYRFLDCDGNYRWIQDKLRLVRDDDGEPLEIVGSMNDITEQKLAGLQMEQSRDQALKLAKAKSEFLANMSHEIRTPMNGVLGMLNLLQTTEMTAEQVDCVGTAYSSGVALMTVLNDILDFSKIESGRLEVESIEFNLRLLVEDIAHLFAGVAQEKGLELISIIPYRVADQIFGDPARLRQVLTNLMSNAIKFTQTGEVVMRIGVRARVNGGEELLFEVVDSGIGINAEAQSRIFEAFEQSDGSTTRLYGGTGLGLSISKKLVELMDGEIGVVSEPGKGASFWFTLPVTQSTDQSAWESHDGLQGLRALIVESNDTSLQYTRHLVSAMGVDCLVAQSALQAKATLRAERVDLIMIDQSLDDMDGLLLIKELFEGIQGENPKVMLLTLMGMKGDARKAHALGAAAYLTKPLRRSQLHAALVEVMSIPVGEQSRLVTKYSLSEIERRFQGGRILVAEDNLVNQKVAISMLTKLGYEADVAENGVEALSALQATRYDLLLIDCQMPLLDGYETVRQIRQQEADGEHLPIVAMTAHILQEDLDACLAAGMDDYILKPMSLETLGAKVRQWLPQDGGEADDAAI